MKLPFAFMATIAASAALPVHADLVSLPIWKEQAELLGYKLPKPIGFSVSYMHLQQGIELDSIAFSNLHIPAMVQNLTMTGGSGSQETEILTLRADAWLLPFFNVYALVGSLQGHSTASVDVSAQIKLPLLPAIPINKRISNFRLDLDGYNYGVGFVLAGGRGNWFTLVDASFTQTALTVIDGNIKAQVISPRIGYQFHLYDQPLRVWGGAMYQRVEQNLSGTLANLNLPADIAGLVGLVDKGDGRFQVSQHLTRPWNPLLGLQYQLSSTWHVLAEIGLGQRQSAFISFDRRF